MTHSNIFSIWNYFKELENTGLILKGHSRGGERSGFLLPSLSLMFDAGIRTQQTPKNIMITHCHCDHSYELPTILAGGWKTLTTIYTPNDPKLIINFIHSSFTLMNGGIRKSPPFKIIQVKPGDEFEITEGRTKIQVNVFKCYHTVDTVGYGISEKKQKLKDEYLSLPGQEIAKLKHEQADIFRNELDKKVIYLTDTKIDVFQDLNIFGYKHIIVECTILNEEEKESAYSHGHIYWGDLKTIVKSHPDNQFILIHFSTRYSDDEIVEFFNKENLPNVFPWLN